MEIRKALAVYYSTLDGRSLNKNSLVAIVDKDNRELAESIALGKGEWGGNGDISEVDIIRYGDLAVIVSSPPTFMNTDLMVDEQTKRKNALAKLTKEDMRILGIKP